MGFHQKKSYHSLHGVIVDQIELSGAHGLAVPLGDLSSVYVVKVRVLMELLTSDYQIIEGCRLVRWIIVRAEIHRAVQALDLSCIFDTENRRDGFTVC